ncbi:DUF427 domain-containing protein [Streptomyces nigra]|uniref:DUF427 domain-containing protein n=1 Tax=Streptomyces nigra TaxID=1827580 RepID=UPI00343E2042
MKVLIGDTVLAEAANDTVVRIEGNAYWPPGSVTAGVLRDSPTPYACPWKGRAKYYDVVAGETVLRDVAWSYPDLKKSAVTRVGRDFSGYVAFDAREVTIEN